MVERYFISVSGVLNFILFVIQGCRFGIAVVDFDYEEVLGEVVIIIDIIPENLVSKDSPKIVNEVGLERGVVDGVLYEVVITTSNIVQKVWRVEQSNLHLGMLLEVLHQLVLLPDLIELPRMEKLMAVSSVLRDGSWGLEDIN